MKKKTMSKAATFAGIVLAAIVAANLDWVKVFAGDKQEISRAAGGICLGLLGWLTQQQASDIPKPKDIASKTDDPTIVIKNPEITIKPEIGPEVKL